MTKEQIGIKVEKRLSLCEKFIKIVPVVFLHNFGEGWKYVCGAISVDTFRRKPKI